MHIEGADAEIAPHDRKRWVQRCRGPPTDERFIVALAIVEKIAEIILRLASVGSAAMAPCKMAISSSRAGKQ